MIRSKISKRPGRVRREVIREPPGQRDVSEVTSPPARQVGRRTSGFALVVTDQVWGHGGAWPPKTRTPKAGNARTKVAETEVWNVACC